MRVPLPHRAAGGGGGSAPIGPERLTALTDGVVAVIITIMVLELKPPQGADLAGLAGLWPTFLSFVLSFTYVAIYWNNHHHFFALVEGIGGAVMWANLNLLFWLSLIPFTTAWMAQHPVAALPVALYGLSLLSSAISWYILQSIIVRMQGLGSPLKAALGKDLKGRLSPVAYITGVGLAFWSPVLSNVIFAGVALAWLVPDRRIEDALSAARETSRQDPRISEPPPRALSGASAEASASTGEGARRG